MAAEAPTTLVQTARGPHARHASTSLSAAGPYRGGELPAPAPLDGRPLVTCLVLLAAPLVTACVLIPFSVAIAMGEWPAASRAMGTFLGLLVGVPLCLALLGSKVLFAHWVRRARSWMPHRLLRAVQLAWGFSFAFAAVAVTILLIAALVSASRSG